MKYRKTNISLILGIVLTLLVLIPVAVSLFFMPYDVNVMDGSAILRKPSLAHIFGTDNFGRDIFCRVIKGAGTTFAISLFTVTAGAAIGTLIGALTGYFGGIADEILMRINDCLASFPSILLALVAVSILDKGTLNICIALGIVFIPSFARIMRAEFMEQKEEDYVLNAKIMGCSDFRIIFVHMLPNTLPILFSSMLVGLNNAVLAEAGLSYLGLGVQPPDPSLGRMLAEAQVYIFSAPWYVIFTCLIIVVAILGITLISENIGVSGVSLKSVKKKLEKMRLQERDCEPARTDKEDGEDKSLLEIRQLDISFIEDDGLSETVHDFSLSLKQGEILGIVGESGSGKSLTSLAVMGILPEKACVTGGSICYHGEDILRLSQEERRKLRGKKIAMIFQEPMTSLNPVQTVGRQIDEMLDLHEKDMTEEHHKKRVLRALEDAGLSDAPEIYSKYPHELSGGMRQRVMIAMALVAKPELIIADEPTTALDADVAELILDIFARINKRYGTSIILISHDLRVITRICDRAALVKSGRIVEELDIRGGAEDTEKSRCFDEPRTEYGKELLAAAFTDKSYIQDTAGQTEKEAVVILEDFSVAYEVRPQSIFGKSGLKFVNRDVNLTINRGDVVGLVGSSGCGKTTLVKGIAGLQKHTFGKCTINCEKPAIGMVFQDPFSSLNPSKKVGWILEEPLKMTCPHFDAAERKRRVLEILDEIELEPEIADRKVSALSGGQRQRIAIAAAIIDRPGLVILDEPVSALDVTIQEQILDILMKLKARRNLTYILISHDMRLVKRVCGSVYLIENGNIHKNS